MLVIFRGDPAELARGEGLSRLSLDLWGVHFPMNATVDVAHLTIAQQQKLARNPHFEVVESDATGAGAADSPPPPAPMPKPRAAKPRAGDEE